MFIKISPKLFILELYSHYRLKDFYIFAIFE